MLKLFQYSKGYRYNNDSLLLFDFLSKNNLKGNILDIGCGCGILGLLVKQKFPNSKVYLLDIQEQNIELSYKNAKENKLEIQSICEDFLNYKSDIKFDFLISNPPFYKKNTQKSQDLHLCISRYQEFMPLEKMFAKINTLIKPNGSFFMCYEASFLDEICASLKQFKLKLVSLQCIHTNTQTNARLVLMHIKKNSKSPCVIMPTLFMYENNVLNPKISEIYENTGTISYDM
ncbi:MULTISPECIES: tRNA1(Val) (adenine(37)-N6)-methyltransferase [unclassified Campylobacter]|uniref:tRNA1(Val) (adenine(37)-N6)-methyltransferase n=1 Tax=unclassified Campylobacter TaxID=2593542 RepID=UPI00126D8A99|nr:MULTISPECIES: methyltransferase [unclassified Campylobacter]EAK0810976.1 methyltransferase domain-containing protein [Campylobacter lari]EAK9888564.1 methyltransferase domain-containing protein [Campylobacter lari]EAL5902771.1 methyltransferase [Campylobacter lari]MCV3355989.1 methyltransferase [Campylobacter sp. RKI_CA19_01122]MCV3382419.1 methyltransferase [Campylobacter sp. IFREMER_LSEM_CL292]